MNHSTGSLDNFTADRSTLALTSVVALAFIIWWKTSRKDEGKLPPGPKGIPILGNVIGFGKAAYANRLPEYIESLHKKYGPIVSFNVGAVTFVFIIDGLLLKKLFAGDDFAERPVEQLGFAERILGGKQGGLILNNGPNHFDMRKLTLATLRDLGVGKQSVDETVLTECNSFCQFLYRVAKEGDGIVDDLKSKVQQCTANIIHSLALGFRYEYDDEKWTSLLDDLMKFFSINLLALPQNFVPPLRYIPLLNTLIISNKLKGVFDSNDRIRQYMEAQIEEHRTTYCEGEIRDFVDLFIKNELESTKDQQMDVDSLFLVIMDLFRAGSDTTANSLAWSIQYLVKYPQIQEELRQEIDEKIGDQVFRREDKRQLVKTVAFVYEVMRFASIVPQTPPHTTRRAVQVSGYVIPANSFVFGSLFAMHRSKEYWGDPETFRIDRWIDAKGEIILHDDAFLPFSTGKRVCVGRQIANIELIIFIVHILQRFKFEKAPGFSDMREEQRPGFLRSPYSYHFKVVCRE